MIVPMIHVHRVQYVLIQEMDLLVYVHHGKMIVLMVSDYLSREEI
jgi:hypothetical protein